MSQVMEVKVCCQLRKKQKVLKFVEGPLVAVMDKGSKAVSGSESPQAVIGGREDVYTRRGTSCPPFSAHLHLPCQKG